MRNLCIFGSFEKQRANVINERSNDNVQDCLRENLTFFLEGAIWQLTQYGNISEQQF